MAITYKIDGDHIIFTDDNNGIYHYYYNANYDNSNIAVMFDNYYGRGSLDRENGPALYDTDNDNWKFWYSNGLLHRIDGPAFNNNGNIRYYLHGDKLSFEEYLVELPEFINYDNIFDYLKYSRFLNSCNNTIKQNKNLEQLYFDSKDKSKYNAVCKGRHPRSTYVYINIYPAFNRYLKRIFDKKQDKIDYIARVNDNNSLTEEEKKKLTSMGNSIDIENIEDNIMSAKNSISKDKLMNISSAVFEKLDPDNITYLAGLI